MSKSMLEQAIQDAEEFKKTATSIAEEKLKEKYKKEFKATIDMLLEQEEENMFGEPAALGGTPLEDPALSSDEEARQAPSDGLKDQLPSAGTQPLNEVDEDEEIEIDFDELQSQFNAKDIQAEPIDLQLPLSEELEEALFEMMDAALDDEEEDSDEEGLEEELNLDYEIVPPGHAGPPTQDEYQEADDVQLAKKMSGLEQQLNEARKALKNEKISNKKQKNENKKLEQMNVQLKEKLNNLKSMVERVNISNAKLLYTNKILKSDSLNERQKTIIIKKVNEAKNVEQAKLLYETLQSAMREHTERPKNSLHETMGPKTTLQIKPKSEMLHEGNPQINRWRDLAGLKDR